MKESFENAARNATELFKYAELFTDEKLNMLAAVNLHAILEIIDMYNIKKHENGKSDCVCS